MGEDVISSFVKLIIVSSFGRHNWLAKELAFNEWRVGLLDCSKILGEWREDDLRNPFGLSLTSELKSEQADYYRTPGADAAEICGQWCSQ